MEEYVERREEAGRTCEGAGEVSPPRGARGDGDEEAGIRLELGGETRVLGGTRGGARRTLKKVEGVGSRKAITGPQRLLILDIFERSGLSATDFAPLVGVKAATLRKWKRAFEELGPEGVMDKPRGAPRGSRVNEVTRRTILLIKKQHPEYGCQRISDMLVRGPGIGASPNTVGRVLKESGYESEEVPTRAHASKPKRFERARPNELWQTDIFTFTMKRVNRRVYLVGFMDDHSRFITSWGLHGSASTRLVIDVLENAITSWGPPVELLTDNGPQYQTWRGKSSFTKHCEKRGIRQILARPKHPETLGKIERFWGTLWRDLVEGSVFLDLEEARVRIGHFIDHYNFQRTHQGIGGLVPADRFFGAAPEVLATLRSRVAENALSIARHGVPKEPFYMTGRLGGVPFSVHEEGGRMILQREGEARREVDLENLKRAEGLEIAAQSGSVEVPAPVCADATDGAELATEEMPPGTSVVDELGGLDAVGLDEEGER